ncbi:FadR/GntR family transcriptional regulator [Desulfopila inferna]|uniref:FadR/GntR family transcriptional regulator n=1 Tax=Desulfopila inferna TaxID=468528 RepID=UPI0019632DDD|nr:FadR/GntR family transcriptional regulator [Desulfopila inferna]MBM9603695.1 FadR family transcriptional regulator [Desulfopila inferna]
MELKPIKPKKISDQVFEQIRELIYKGAFKPGQQITPERNLAASMQVSRTSVRNAINKLVTMGLLEHRQGQGTFVASPENRRGNLLAAAMATEEATLDDLLEVRLGLEANAAELAARRATETDLLSIEKSLKEMEEDIKSEGHISTNADAAFHMAVTFATKNPVLIHLMRNFYDFLFIGIKQNLTHMYQVQGEHENILDHHKSVYDMIRKRKSKEAGDMMRHHIKYVQDYFRKHHGPE